MYELTILPLLSYGYDYRSESSVVYLCASLCIRAHHYLPFRIHGFGPQSLSSALTVVNPLLSAYKKQRTYRLKVSSFLLKDDS